MTAHNDINEISKLKEILMTNSIQIDTLSRLLMGKGIFDRDEYLDKMREVQNEYFNHITQDEV